MSDEMKRFSQRARTALAFTQAAAEVPDNDAIQPEHLLLGLLQASEGVAAEVLAKFGVTYERVLPLFCVETGGRARPVSTPKSLSDSIKRTLTQAHAVAHAHHQHYIGTEHLLWALLDSPEAAISDAFSQLGVDLDAVRKELETHFKTDTPS